ncbi:MAG: hypothetical protein J1E85_05935 [Ruminococcus sp.]|nr:hypothetical protein [Ruminococcus sp.]
MENMIKKIVDADNEAKALEQAALQEKEELQKQIDDEAKKIYEKYMSDAEETVKRNNINEENKARQKLNEIKKKQSSVNIKLQADFEQNCDKWVDEIVSRTLAE